MCLLVRCESIEDDLYYVLQPMMIVIISSSSPSSSTTVATAKRFPLFEWYLIRVVPSNIPTSHEDGYYFSRTIDSPSSEI